MKRIVTICLCCILLYLPLSLCGCEISRATFEFDVSDATIQDTPYAMGRYASVQVVTTCTGGVLYDSDYPHGIEGGHPTLILPDGTAIEGGTEVTHAMTVLSMGKGDTVNYWWSFDVPEDFKAGTYTVTVEWYGSEQTIEGVEFTMTELLHSPTQAE